MSNPAKKDGGRLFEGKTPLMWPSEFEDGTANVMADTTALIWGRGLAIHRETLMVMVACFAREASSSPESLNRVHAPDLFVYNCYILN